MTFHDNANAAIVEGGDVINQLIPQIHDSTRILRTIGEDQQVKFVRVNDPMDPGSINLAVGHYDVVMTIGTSYASRRVEAAQAMMDAIQVWPDLMSIAGDLVAQAQDWPGADKLAERIKKTIPPQFLEEGEGQALTPQQIQEIEQQMQALAMELEAAKKELEDKAVEHQIAMYNAETQRIRALSDNMVDDTKLNQDAIETILKYSAELDKQELQRDSIASRPSASPAGT